MIKKIQKVVVPAAIGAFTLMAPAMALAADTNNIVPDTLVNIDNIVVIIRAVIRFILIVAFVLAFIFLIVGGIRWITAGGDEKGVAGARGMITAALIGLVIVLVAFAIIKLVETFFGVSIISQGVTIQNIHE